MTEQNSKATKYVEYMRKSTDDKEKQVLSLGSQRDVLDRLKGAHNLTVTETIEEKMSAKRPGRPGFAELVKKIKSGKVDGIVTWAPHRLSRNSVDIGELINLFDTGQLREIVTDSHTYRNNPMDIFMLGFHCLQAKFENDNKAIDVRAGMDKCAKLGIYPNCPPLGYLPDKRGIKGARKRDIDPVNFPIMRKMWELMLSGTLTPYQIHQRAVEEWGLRTRSGKKPAKCIIYVIFHNPFYYGEFEFPRKSGNWYTGKHTPMVTKQEFDQVQKLLRKPDPARPVTNYFPFGGCVLHCGECGCAITGMAKTKKLSNGTTQHYVYYTCTKKRGKCMQKPITERALAENIESLLDEIHIPAAMHEIVMAVIRKQDENQVNVVNAQYEANKIAYGQVQKKISGLIDMRASQLITDMEFKERREEIEKEKNRLSEIIKNVEDNSVNWVDTAEKLFRFAELAKANFKNGSPEMQRGILSSLGWNLQITDKKLVIQGENWIAPMKLLAKHMNIKFPTLEPVSPLQNKGKIPSFYNSRVLCSLVNDVRNALVKNPKKLRFTNLD